MKKTLSLFAAIFCLSGCVQEELESNQRSLISFSSNDSDFTETRPTSRAATLTQSTITQYGVSCSYYPRSGTYESAGCGSYFFNLLVNASDGRTGYYWPGLDYNLSFFAYTPCGDAVQDRLQLTSTAEQHGMPEYHYEVPASTDDQLDFMTCNILDHEGISRAPVPLAFSHKCTDVRFVCFNQSSEELLIKEIAILGMKYSGNLVNDSWELEGAAGTYEEHPFLLTTATQLLSGETLDVTGTEDHFIVLPQTVAEGTEIFQIKTDETDSHGETTERTYHYVLPSDFKFDGGKSYKFKINIGGTTMEIEEVSISPWLDINFFEGDFIVVEP